MSKINNIIKRIEELGETAKTVNEVTKNLKAIFSETTQEEKEEIMKEITRRRNKYTKKQKENLTNINYFIASIKCKTNDEIKEILEEKKQERKQERQERRRGKKEEKLEDKKLLKERKAQEKQEEMRQKLENLVKNLGSIFDDTLIDTEKTLRDTLYIQGNDLLAKDSTPSNQIGEKITEIEFFYNQRDKRIRKENKEKKSSTEKKLDDAIKKLDKIKREREELEEKLKNNVQEE